jgi:peroxiredoxin
MVHRVLFTAAVALSACAMLFAGRAAMADDAGVAIGAAAPQFSLQNYDGSTVSLKELAGKIVVLEWTNPNCPFVRRHYRAKTMTTLAAEYKTQNVVWIAINSSYTASNADNQTWAQANAIPYPILNDSKGATGHAYGASSTPDMFIIGTDGKLLYEGAIDNNPDGSDNNRVNYVRKALDEILAGKPVSVPVTQSYGCPVKYAD